ncbi:MAG: tetratricopeptide repeat protein [Planctomycetes bacterium]|nr:tetratricopeptide repeat protein [Planctomycetota bacterium]
MTWVLLAISLIVGWAVPTQNTGGQAASGTPQASSGTPAAAVDGPSVRRRFDDAREHFLTGYYRHAFEEFSDLAGADDEELATSASIAMADCQMEWGDYEGALDTLQSVRESARAPDDIGTGSAHGSGSARWHRAAAAAYSKLGDYDKAIEHGQQALKLDDDHMRARYELGRLYETVGRWDDAIHTYQYFDKLLAGEARFPETAEDAHYAGVGFYRYSVLTRSEHLTRRTKYVVRDVLQPAVEILDLSYWPAQLAIGDLLFEKYNLTDALVEYKAVLKSNPQSLEAHLGLVRIALDGWDFENVESRVAVCLDINPRSAEAYVLLAACRMLERRFEDAVAVAKHALAINPNHITALSYLAAAQIRAGYYSDAEETKRRVYQLNAAPAVLHAIIGKQLSDGRQFPESEEELRKAIEFDPTNPDPRNELAMMYMQWGYEDKARTVVDAALDLDAFNTRTFNTERLLDEMAGFLVYETENFEIHYSDSQDAVLGKYTGEYLESIYAELSEDYDTKLETKTIIEFFPDHRKFAVRIHGKPWIHTVGACTGRVIAMDAPREDVFGRYNVANVLRHEFTHTVTLAATRNRIPHWFTEGLAVLQEDRPKSWKWKNMLAQRLRRDDLFSLEKIDWGFIRPRQADDRQMAYAQSEWMCEYLIEKNGYDVINLMLRMYRDGQVQRDVFPSAAGVTTAEFDEQFKVWALADAQVWGLPLDPAPDPFVVKWMLRTYPKSADLHADMAEILIRESDYSEALAHAERCLELKKHHVDGLKMAADASILLAQEQPSRDRFREMLERAKNYYELLAEHHPTEPAGPEFLAEWANEHDHHDEAVRWSKKLKALQPLNPLPYRILSGIYLQRDDDAHALPELLELSRHEEHDPDVPRQIARIYAQQDKLRAAASWYRQSLDIDPYDVKTHRTYATLLDDLKLIEKALHEYEMLTILEPKEALHHNELAFAYYRAGRRDQAKEAARKAVELDPNSPARQLLDD